MWAMATCGGRIKKFERDNKNGLSKAFKRRDSITTKKKTWYLKNIGDNCIHSSIEKRGIYNKAQLL
jgi:hypothetical protein